MEVCGKYQLAFILLLLLRLLLWRKTGKVGLPLYILEERVSVFMGGAF